MSKEKSARVRFSEFITRNRNSKGYLLRKTSGEFLYRICRAFLLFGLCFLIIQPLLDKLSVSFMTQQDLYDATVISIPRHFTTENYGRVNDIMSFWAGLGKTLFIVLSGAVLQIVSCTLAGYGFARYKFPLRNFWFMCVMVIIVVPPQTIMAPLYLNFRFFDLFGIIRLISGQPVNMLNNIGGYLMLCATGMGLKSGLYVFMLRQYFRGVPKELEEAAFVDGCGRFKTFLIIMLPDAMPMITSCFLFSFVWQWTDSFYTTLFLTRFGVLASGLGGLAEGVSKWWSLNYGSSSVAPMGYTQMLIATGMLMCLAPLILLYLVAQKAFVQSLSQTGIKM
jgi:multiple sugar transport system permease protein